jgi:hypothetical protein
MPAVIYVFRPVFIFGQKKSAGHDSLTPVNGEGKQVAIS